MNTGLKIVEGIGEGHIEVMNDLETKAMDIRSLANGLELLAGEIGNHFSPSEDSSDKADGLLAMLFSGIESIKKLSGDIQELSDAMQKAFNYRLKEQKAGKE